MVEYPPGPFPENLTWDEFLALPYELRNASLVDGEVIVNPPSAQHQWIVDNIQHVFRLWITAGRGRGMFSEEQPVKIDDRRGYQPDFAWYPAGQSSRRDGLKAFSGLPALIVEVLSPSTSSFDRTTKRADYEKVGIGELWFVDQQPGRYGLVACQRSSARAPFTDRHLRLGDRITSPLLEGFDVGVADLFEEWGEER